MKQYKGSFKSLDDNIYDVVFTLVNTTSSEIVNITLGENPIVTSVNSEDDIYFPIKYDSAKINIVTDEIYDDLNATKYGDIKVELIDTTTQKCMWFGYVKPQLYNQEIFYNTNEITIECCGFLEMLKYIDYDKVYGSISLFHIVFDGILKVNGKGYIYVQDSCTLTYDQFSAPWLEKTDHPLCNLFINNRNFIDDDNEPLKYNEVLESIFKYFNLVCISDGYDIYLVDYNSLTANADLNMNSIVNFYQYYEENSHDKVQISSKTVINKENISSISLSKSKLYNKISLVGKRYNASVDVYNFKDYTELIDDKWEAYVSAMLWSRPLYNKNFQNLGQSDMSLTFIMNRMYKNTCDNIKLHNYSIYKGPNNTWQSSELQENDSLINNRSILDFVSRGSGASKYYIGACIMDEVNSTKDLFTETECGTDSYIKFTDYDAHNSSSSYTNPNSNYNRNFNPKFSDKKIVLSLPQFYKNISGTKLDFPIVTDRPDIYNGLLPFMTINLDEGYIHNKCRLKLKLNGKFKPIYKLESHEPWMYYQDGYIRYKYDHNTKTIKGYGPGLSVPIYNSVYESVTKYNLVSSSYFKQTCFIKYGNKYWTGNSWTSNKTAILINTEVSNTYSFKSTIEPYFDKYEVDGGYFYIDLPKIDNPNEKLELILNVPDIRFTMKKLPDNPSSYSFENTIWGGYVWYDDIDISFDYSDDYINSNDDLEDIKYETIIDEDISNEFDKIENIITTNKDNIYDKSSILYKGGYLEAIYWDIDNFNQSGPTPISGEEYKLESYLSEYSNKRNIVDIDIVGLNLKTFNGYEINYPKLENSRFVVNSIEKNWKSNTALVQLVEIINTWE